MKKLTRHTIENYDDENGVLFRLEGNCDRLIIGFAGLAGEMGIPIFEFKNLLSPLNVNILLLRDIQGYWFHKGIKEAPGGIDEVKIFLEKIISDYNPKRIITIGNSGGAYSAMLFGILLNANEVHAFSSRTFLNPVKRILTRDQIFKKHYKKVIFNREMQRKYFDLKVVLATHPNKIKINLYYALNQKIDRTHSERMANIANIKLHPFQYEHHDLVRFLKENGELQKILAKISS